MTASNPKRKKDWDSVQKESQNNIPEFQTYVELLKFIIHRLNIHYHVPLDRLARYADIPFARLDEARKLRLDRKQVELSVSEHQKLIRTLHELGATREAKVLHGFGVSDLWPCSGCVLQANATKKDIEIIIEKLKEIKGSL